MSGRKLVQFVLVLLAISWIPILGSVASAGPAEAHQDGCHRWHSCPSDSGSYVCGDLGYYDECAGGGLGGAEVTAPEPVADYNPPRRPSFAAASTGPGGLVQLPVRAESGSRLVISDRGHTVATVTATGALQTITLKAATGTHLFRAVATDAAGNSSLAGTVSVAADATPPSVSSVDLSAGTASDPRSQLEVSTEAAVIRYVLFVDGRVVRRGTNVGGTLAQTLDLANGRHQVTLQLRDTVGNVRTLARQLRVHVPHLQVTGTPLSEPNQGTQTFRIEGAPDARGTFRIPGGPSQRFRLTNGSRVVTLGLPDGVYPSPVVMLRDAHGRRGLVRLTRFVVDTTAPDLTAASLRHRAEVGLFAGLINAERGSHVTWRLVDDAGHVIARNQFVASAAPKRLQRDVAEGDYQLQLAAADQYGNKTTRTVAAHVAADPLTPADIVYASLALALLLGALVALFLAGRRISTRLRAWRERRRLVAARRARERQHAAVVAAHESEVARYRQGLAVHERDDARWRQRRDELVGLLKLAREASADQVSGYANIKLKRGEAVYCTVPGALVDMRSRNGTPYPTVVDQGLLTITNMRVAFNGSKNRDWSYDKLETMRHVDQDRTMMTVSNRKNTSGFIYTDAERTRLYLDLALADRSASRARVIDTMGQRLHQHETARPTPPSPPGPPPAALDLSAEAEARGPVPTPAS